MANSKQNVKKIVKLYPRVQQREKQFKCDFCDKTFTQRRNQRAHIRTVHEKLKPFQCTHCGLTANRKFNLLSHIKKMHGSTEGSTSVIDTRLSGSGKIAFKKNIQIKS